MPRGARLDAPGTLQHMIVRGIERCRIVNDVADRENFVKRLAELSADTKTTIYAWAIMTNHAHILLRSSDMGLSGLMRRLLTGYAVSYNRRHRRWGHLFQNRYKSIVCDEDAYFTELGALYSFKSVDELKGDSRRKEVSGIRNRIAIELVKGHGVALAEVARRVGVSTSAISKIIKRAG